MNGPAYTPGQHVRIVRDLYPEPGNYSFVGQTGTVTGDDGRCVIVRGLTHPTESPKTGWGFAPDEIEPA